MTPGHASSGKTDHIPLNTACLVTLTMTLALLLVRPGRDIWGLRQRKGLKGSAWAYPLADKDQGLDGISKNGETGPQRPPMI